MRIPLTNGQTISLWRDSAQHTFQIDSVIGDGASCIAYSAHKVGTPGKSLNYRIKECYPYRADIMRNGQQLTWKRDEEKATAFEKMRRVHELIADLRNNENVGNNITSAELYEGNGTLYSVMEVNHARTYDKDSSRDLHAILATMRVLAEVVGDLHKQGFLHLDIKPENFLVTQKPNTNIWLFDVDSITAMDDITSGRSQSIPYSGRWAAPEQVCNKLKKICPATDLFAIGVILFEKVMGREVTSMDCGLFAQWDNSDFDGDIFEDVNPKIKRYLRNIFKKTLAVNVSRRFQSASELAAALEEACKAIEKPYLISACPPVTTSFVGRGSEMKAILEAFQKSHVVFLHGEGGIGKSTLALAYANHEAKQYDAILFLRYRGSLEEALSEIEIQNYDEDNESKRRRTLKRLLDNHILLIFDNFDVAPNEDPFLMELMKHYNANILFTSRTDFSGVLSGDVIHVEVGKLSESNLLQIFSTAAKQTFNDEECSQIEKLFSIIDYHTYAAEVLGRKLEASGWTIDYLTQRLTDGLLSLDDGAKIRVSKEVAAGKRFSRYSVPEIFRALFRISELSENQKRVLRNMYLLRFLNVDKNTFRNYVSYAMRKNDFDTVQDSFNDLVELNWIQREQEYFIIHPIVAELIHQDLQPNEDNCPGFFHKIQYHIDYHFDYTDTMEEHQFSRDADLLCSFLLSVNLTEEPYLQIAVNWLEEFTQMRIEKGYSVGALSNKRFLRLYQKLTELTQNNHLQSSHIRAISIYLLKIVSLDYFGSYYGENAELREQERRTILEHWFLNAKRIAESESTSEREALLDTVYTAFLLADEEIPHFFPDDFLHKLYSERPRVFELLELSLLTKERIGIPLSDEEKEVEESISSVFSSYGRKSTDSESTQANVYQHSSGSEINTVKSVVDWISRYPRSKDMMEQFLTELDLNDLEKQVDIFTNEVNTPNICEEIDYTDGYGLAFAVSMLNPHEECKLYNAVVAILKGDYSDFQMYMNHDVVIGTMLKEDSVSQYQYDVFLKTIVTLCSNVGKYSWALPYMVSAVSHRFSEDSDESERALELIDEVQSFASLAAEEVGKDHPDYPQFIQIQHQFAKWYNKLIGKDWSLKE